MKNLIKITTLGKVTFDIPGDKSAGFGFDVSFDNMNIPFIPIARLIRENYSVSDRIQIGFARPEGYEGILKAFLEMGITNFESGNLIRDYFTERFYDSENSYYVRSLKKGLVFYANVDGEKEELSKVLPVIESIDHIGAAAGDADGKVKIEVLRRREFKREHPELKDTLTYNRLDYSLMLVSPTCVYAPYKDGANSYNYIPGSYILKSFAGRWKHIKCTNAYIGANGKRMTPMPACVSLVKANKEMLHYRLASGKDPKRTEQDVSLSNAYTSNVDSHFVSYMVPELERYFGSDGKIYDTLSPGQIFSGSIYGTDRDIRQIYEYLTKNNFIRLGHMTFEGLGEAVIRITEAKEAEIPRKSLTACFDLRCLSNTLILNDDGMSDIRIEALLKEVEYILGEEGRLEIVGAYTNDFNDYMDDPEALCPRNAVRMFTAGSVLRIRTKDGSPIDINKLEHCFIGERTREGYGEAGAYPALDTYYRVAEKKPVREYDFDIMCPTKSIVLGIEAASRITEAVLKKMVKNIAYLDAEDASIETEGTDAVPTFVLSGLRDFYAPMVPTEKLKVWYLEALKEEIHA